MSSEISFRCLLIDPGLISPQSLLDELHNLNGLYRDEVNDHNAVKLANRSIQNQERNLREELRSFQDSTNRGAFTMVLLDGDGMIFNDHYLEAGEGGGRDAAVDLSEHLRDYFRGSVQHLPPNYKVIVRIYVNMKGLMETCCRAGIIQSWGILDEFFKGFTGSKILFDVVDVGAGKERADSKITGMLSHSFFPVFVPESTCLFDPMKNASPTLFRESLSLNFNSSIRFIQC